VAESAESAPGGVPHAAEAVFGAKIRAWRKTAGLSLQEVAQLSNLSVGYISQVERDLANPSLEALKRIANAVGKSIGELFSDFAEPDEAGESAERHRFWVTRGNARKQIVYPGSGIMNELLSPDVQHKLEIIWVEAAPGTGSGGHPHSHVGEECGVIFAGCMRLWLGDECRELFAGDSVYLDSTLPHRWIAAGTEGLKALWVITPPTF
jgi:transcriptional regulator with XRE-family HTH domain